MNVPSWSGRQRGERDKFARAVDDHRASDGGDPTLDEELRLVERLRQAGTETPGPGPDTRTRMAAVITEGRTDRRIPDGRPAAARPATTSKPAAEGPRRRPRVAQVVAAAGCLLIAFGGLATLLSDDALPGDSLYPIKRVREAASLELTFNAEGKAAKRLEFAGTRVRELRSLAERPDGDTSGYAEALTDFDEDLRAGVAGMTAVATSGTGDQFTVLRSWVADQSSRLDALEPAIPAAVVPQHAAAMTLLNRAAERASALDDRMSCLQITSGAADELGAIPATDECARPPNEALADLPGNTEPAPETSTEAPPTSEPGASSELVTVAPLPTGEALPDALPTGTAPPPGSLTSTPITSLPTVLRERPPAVPSPTPKPPAIRIPPLLPGVPGIGIG